MNDRSIDKKRKILEVVQQMLEEMEPEEITIREIAARAEIGIGLINYHFHSRDNLIREAAGTRLTALADVLERLEGGEGDMAGYLERMLCELADAAVKNLRLSKLSAEYELMKGDYRICLYLMPALKQIFRGEKSDGELRLIAFQIIVTLQSIYLRQEAFHLLTGIDIASKAERDELIHSIVRNFTGSGGV